MGKNRSSMPIAFGGERGVTVTGVDFDENGTMRASSLSELNSSRIEDARRSAKEGNWHDGDLARLNRDNISDLDYLNDEVTRAGFEIDSIRNPYNHNNVRLHHPDHPELSIVVDKMALQKMLSSTPQANGTDFNLSDVLTKINTTMAESNSFMGNTNTVTIAARMNNRPPLYQENKGDERNFVMNIELGGNSSKDTLFSGIDDYIENNR